MTDQTLDSIVSGGRASAPTPDTRPVVDEPEALIGNDGAESTVPTDHVEGERLPDDTPATDGAQGTDKANAFKRQREEKAKRYTEQVASFEQRLNDQNAQWENRFNQLLQRLAPPQQPAQQPEAPDFFVDPQKAVQHELQPVVQQMLRAQQEQREAQSQLMAVDKHGAEAVSAAEQWIRQRVQKDPAGTRWDYERIMASPHPYGELVRSYQQSQALSEIGTDPAAYREKVRAELLAEIQSSDGRQPATPQPNGPAAAPAVMPTNLADVRNSGTRTGSAWQGPTSLKDIFKPSG